MSKSNPKSSSSPSHLQLVTPSFTLDPSRLISSTEPEPLPSVPLLPSSDLPSLLSDPDLHSRFREGRYKPGVNHNLRITNLATCFSATLGSIAERCPDRPHSVSINTLLNLCSFIGATSISSWDQAESLISSISLLRRRTPHLSGDLVTHLSQLIDSFPPTVPIGKERWYTISGCTDEILAGVGGKLGVSAGTLATIATALVLSEQSPAYTSAIYRTEIERTVSRFRQWIGWKAMVIRMTVELAEEEPQEQEL